MTEANPYANAAYLGKLRQTGVMALTDIDGTMMDGGEPTESELVDRKRVRELLEKSGVVAGAVTARTCGLTLSQASYAASSELRAYEPPPRWGVDENGKRFFVDLAEVPYFRHCLEWDVVAGFGSYIIMRNGTGYRLDREYAYLLRYDYTKIRGPKGERITLNENPWRLAMLAFIGEKCPWAYDYMSPIDSHLLYFKREVDVAPLEFRFQLNFVGSKGFKVMRYLQNLIWEERTAGHPLAIRIATVDESRLDKDPEECRYTLYLVPWGARKEKLINRLFHCSVEAAEMEPGDVKLFYAGDTLTDLRAGLWAGGDADFKFLLPRWSRLAPYLMWRKNSYGSHDLSFLWKGHSNTRLVPTGSRGEYRFVHKIRGERKNLIVVADERYPHEKTAPGSVAAFLDEYMVHRRVPL